MRRRALSRGQRAWQRWCGRNEESGGCGESRLGVWFAPFFEFFKNAIELVIDAEIDEAPNAIRIIEIKAPAERESSAVRYVSGSEQASAD